MPVITRNPSADLAIAGSALFMTVSAAQNITFGYELGAARSIVHGVIFALGSLGGDLLKPISLLLAIAAVQSRSAGRSVLFGSLATICIAYSFIAGLGFASNVRSDLIDGRETASAAHARQSATYDRTASEKASLAPARPKAELQAMLTSILADPRSEGCKTVNGPFTRQHCPRVAEWRAELARAQRHTELDTLLTKQSHRMDSTKRYDIADPQASSIAHYVSAMGTPTRADDVAPWLTLLVVVFFEVGSALSLAIVGAVLRPVPDPSVNQTPTAPADGGTQQDPWPKDDLDDVSASVLTTIVARGGSLKGSQNRIADTLGLSKTTAHRVLHRLSNAGRLSLSTGARGTVVIVH